MIPTRRIRVLIVDDSAIVRKILSEALQGEAGIEVVGTAPDPYVARDKIIALKPDVLTLDVEMPRMDGLTFLKKLMKAHPMPVIMISSVTQASSAAAIDALAEGAVEVIAKPSGPYSVGEFRGTLAAKIRAAAACRTRLAGTRVPVSMDKDPTASVSISSRVPLIAIGASTGGTDAIERILVGLPPALPPIVVVQHIPAGFSRAFADRLDKLCALRVREATDGDILEPGTVLVAPGNFHLTVTRSGSNDKTGRPRLRASVATGETVCYQRPSVDVLFNSVAALKLEGVIAFLLTGMGSDGAEGMLRLRREGSHTIAQDESSCVVFGMPKEAIRMGAAREVVRLDRIPKRIVELTNAVAACTAN